MPHSRRTFLNRLAGLATVPAIGPAALAGAPGTLTEPTATMSGTTLTSKPLSDAPTPAASIKALAFDAYPIFDPRPLSALAETLLGARAQELMSLWRSRQFEYQWLRVLSGTYKDFWAVTNDALSFTANTLQIDLTEDQRRQLMDAWLQLKTWPDVLPALQAFKQKGLKLVFLSNMTEKMLRANMKVNGLEEFFDEVLSTDQVRNYKPSRAAYQLAVDKLKLHRSEIGFVAFAGWDACGGKAFGYPTYWLNRQGQADEELGVKPDWVGRSLAEMKTLLAG